MNVLLIGASLYAVLVSGHDAEGFYSVAPANDGVVIAGYTRSWGASAKDGLLVALDEEGNALWTKTYGLGGEDVFRAITPFGSGYLAVGRTKSFGAGGNDVLAVAVDGSGSLLWAKAYGVNTDYDKARAVAEAGDGGAWLGGSTWFRWNKLEAQSPLLIKVSSTGSLEWARVFYSGSSAEFRGLTTDGDAVVAAGMGYISFKSEIPVVKVSSNGQVLWAKILKNPAGSDYAVGVVRGPEGYYLFGSTNSLHGGLNYDALLVKLDENGNLLWAKAYGGSSMESFNAAIPQGDGLLLTGYTRSCGSQRSLLLAKVDWDGNLLWARIFDHGDEVGLGAASASGGPVWVGFSEDRAGDGLALKTRFDGSYEGCVQECNFSQWNISFTESTMSSAWVSLSEANGAPLVKSVSPTRVVLCEPAWQELGERGELELDGAGTIYSADGRLLGRLQTLSRLPRGVYFVETRRGMTKLLVR